MPDDFDRIVELEQGILDSRIKNAAYDIPPGVPGECEQCGGDSGRLIGGKCAPCRDELTDRQIY